MGQGYTSGGDDADAVHMDEGGEFGTVSEKVSPVGADQLLIEDSADSSLKKYVQITNLPGGADADAIHDNVASEIVAVTEKTIPAQADVVLIEDSDAADVKKRVELSNIPAYSSRLAVYNDSGAQVDPDDVVYLSGFNVGTGEPTIALADADNAAAMPAIGIVDTSIANLASGSIVVGGIARGITTTGFASNDTIYVDTTPGTFTNVRPTVDAIQAIGKVLQVAASGSVIIVGAGRSNDVPIAPSFTDYTNAGHDHEDAAGGGTLASAALPTAITTDTASEISGLTLKGTPVSGDYLVIEDSAAANVKKHITVGSLPGGSGTDMQVDTGGSLANADFQDGGDINFTEAAGVVTAAIKSDTVTYDKMQDATQTNIFLGRDTAGAGTIEEIDKTAALAILNVADGADVTNSSTVDAAGAIMHTDIGTNGMVAATTGDAYVARTITGTTNEIDVADGGGQSGNPTLSLAAPLILSGDYFRLPAKIDPDPTGAVARTYYNSTNAEFRYHNGAWRTVVNEDEAQTLTNKDLTDQTNKLHWSKSVTIETPADGDRIAVYMNERAVTITGVSFASVAGTSVLFNVEYATTIASGTVIHTDTCATSTPEWDVTPSGTTAVPTDQIIAIEITTVTGGVTQFHVTIEGDHT